ncbi:MAG TPA: preprotein translocase subunit SecG [Gammaproteobacteria bacterium]|jgi:preprotein translocase subunit SecG|nr:preprotein translocase subunit SecG [Gammaproteobacteria bacterium]
MLQTIVLGLHLLASLFIIGLVLMQRGKGADAGSGFGAGASGTVFGARGSANFLSRATSVLIAVFFATSLTLSYLATQRKAPTSLLDTAPPAASQPAPVAPPASQPGDLPPPPSNPPADDPK